MPRSVDSETLPLLSGKSGRAVAAAASDALKISVRRQPKDTIGSASPYRAPPLSTPRSPFDEGFPMLFSSPIPSPRPHRLSFSYARHDRFRALHVFLTLLMSVVGAGMLSVPYTFLLVPTWQAVAGIVGVGAAMAATSIALLYAHVQLAHEEERVLHIGAGRRFSSFQSIAIVAGGDIFGYIVSVVTAVGIYGGCVGCIRIVKDISPFMVAITQELLGYAAAAAADDASAAASSYLLWGSFLLVVFPLCLLQDLSALRVSSYLGFAFSLYLVAAVVLRALVTDEPPTSAPLTVIAGPVFSRLSQSISIYNYAFMMQLNLLPLFIQLRGSFAEPLATSAAKMTRAIVGVSGFCAALYVVFGVFAKQLYGATIRGNVLLNLERDAVMAVPLVAVFLTVVLSFPLLFHPLRGVIEELLFAYELAFATRFATTAVLLLSQLALAVWVPGIEVVFALTGASSCLLICFVFPVALFMSLYPWRYKLQRRALVMGALGAIVAFFTVIGVDATGFLLFH